MLVFRCFCFFCFPLFSVGSARDGNRTRTGTAAHRILSPACLPIPPPEPKILTAKSTFFFLTAKITIFALSKYLHAMSLEEEINEGIKSAMKAQNKVRLETLRNVKKYILEAKTAGTGIDQLPDAEVLKIIQKLAKQGQESATIYKEQGRSDLFEYEAAQVAILHEYLPKQLTQEELVDTLQKIIADCGATSAKEMGRVMGIASKELAGVADGKVISATVRELLR